MENYNMTIANRQFCAKFCLDERQLNDTGFKLTVSATNTNLNNSSRLEHLRSNQ